MQIIFILLIVLSVLLLIPFIKQLRYKRSDYYKQTKNSYKKVFNDKGLYGEYLTSISLNKLKGNKRVLYNLYLEKENGETTEIDMVLLHESGIYVIESKNYSGEVLGEEQNRYWNQTLESGKVYSFYNPIKQNANHIRYLERALRMKGYTKFYSIIVFGEQTILSKIPIETPHVFVIKRDKLIRLLRCLALTQKKYSKEQIDKMYERLIVFCNPLKEVKQRHVEQINRWYQ